MRPQSLSKPSTLALSSRGFPLLAIDTSAPIDPNVLRPFTTIISAVDNFGNAAQSALASAAKTAGVKRFVPCGFTTIAAPGGAMKIRDDKEAAYAHIFQLKLGYTIIDVGFWHQMSYPRVPSGRLDYSFLSIMPPNAVVYGSGDAKNLLTDVRDVGNYVARIVKDPRTLNKRVFTWSDELSQKEIFEIVERVTGEKVERTYVSEEEIVKGAREAREAYAKDKSTVQTEVVRRLYGAEYWLSKFVSEDNTRENALYLGYLDARELYPDFKPISFEDVIKEAVEGNAVKLYVGRFS
jgi:uncharacterized protein YbjT (DUF2867 family)